jgi:acyl-CoA synthetase (AMP-forming)/AMP-acid ligase II
MKPVSLAGVSTVPESIARAEAALLGPGAPFEIAEEIVLGERMRVFRRRARSLAELIVRSQSLGDAEAMLFSDGASEQRFTFADLAHRVASVGARLRDEHGIGRGDRVAILAANCPEWILAFWATVSLGAVAVGLNGWWTGDEIRFALSDAAPKLLVADATRFARLAGVPLDIPVAVIGRSDAFEPASGAQLPAVDIAEDDPAVILYTSGTTGRPKGVVHSHRNVLALVDANTFNGARNHLLHPPPPGAAPACVLVTSPLFHVSGLHSAAVSCLANGTRSVWLMGRFDAATALRLIERERVTAWGYTATLLHRVVHHPDVRSFDLSSVRQLGGGGSPIAPQLQARARDVFAGARRTFGVGYGLTECTALATLAAGDELIAHPTSVGRPIPIVDVEIRDEGGRPAPDGVDGEVFVRSAMVMLEYWRNPEATREAIHAGRWLRTGDIGHLRDGRLYLSTRKRDLILRGGENVYPAEIEQRLEQHPSVAEAAVVGVDHAELGQEVKAIVVPAAGARVDTEELARWVGEALAYFKVPAHWEVRPQPLPRNATGKVLKEVLRGEAEAFVPE